MLTQRLLSRTFPLYVTFVLSMLWSLTPGIAQERSGYLLSEWIAWAGHEDNGAVGHLNPAKGQATFELKSETKAFRWSLWGTVVPISTGAGIGMLYSRPKDDPVPSLVLMGSGLLIGPSLGYFYGGRTDRGMKGILIRAGMEMFFVMGAMIAAEEVGTSGLGDFSNAVAAAVILFAGQGFVLAHGIYDIAKVKSEVRKYNQSLQETTLMVAPKYFTDSKATGIQVRITF